MIDLIDSQNGVIEAQTQRQYRHGEGRRNRKLRSNVAGQRSWCGVQGDDPTIYAHPLDNSKSGFDQEKSYWNPPIEFPDFAEVLAGGGTNKW